MKDITRNAYGAIIDDQFARTIVLSAVASNLLEKEYCEFDHKRRGTALNYDVYDHDPKSRQILVQQRLTTGDKYGLHPKKTYLVITYFRSKAKSVEPAPKPTLVVKLAKLGPKPGDILRTITGTAKKPVKLKSPSAPRDAYKAVAVDPEGNLRSIFSGRFYRVGGTYRETARKGHGGGWYTYRTPQEAMMAEVPETSKFIDAPRAVVRVRCSGRKITYDNGKEASSRMTIMEVLAV